MITTKAGKKGPAKIELETFYGVSRVSQKLNVMTPGEFAEGVNFAEGTEIFTPDDIAGLYAGGGENWQERFFRDAPFGNVQLSATGGGDAVNYFISGNAYNADGTIINQNYKRYAVRTNINAKLSDKLKVGVNAYYSREEGTGVRANLATGLTWDPTTPAFDEDGEYNFATLIPSVGNGAVNPLLAPENNIRENYDHQLIANGYLNYNILDNLVFNVSGGIERRDFTHNSYVPSFVANQGAAAVNHQNVTNYQTTARLTYTYDKNPNHRLQIDAIAEQVTSKRELTESSAEGFFTDQLGYKNLALGEIQRNKNEYQPWQLVSYLGRVNYALFDRFLFTGSIRADGSSKFPENKWGYFPSGSFAWRLSDESFIKNINVIDNLKLRASYGLTGNQSIPPFSTIAFPIVAESVNYPFSGQESTIGVAPSSQLANKQLTWETTAQTNLGIDVGLWQSRLTLSMDVYRKHTRDVLLPRLLPSYVGPTVVFQNIGEIENKGIDLSLGMTLIDEKDWHVSSILSVSRNNNKVLALVGDGEPIEMGAKIYGSSFPVKPTRVEVGLPISTFRGYQFEGVYQLGEEDEAALYGKEPGDARYADINGDTLISTDDIVTVGDGNADITWGWNWTVTWKKFDLNFMVLGSHGNDIYNFTRMRMMGLGAAQFHAVHTDYKNRWTDENPSEIPSGRDGTEFLSSQFIEDGSYVTLKNIALGYTFDKVLNGIGMDALRLYVSAENLFMFTDYTGFDPEATSSGNSDTDLGIDYNAYPINRSFTVGLKMTF